MKVLVLTVSDRASKGIYEDLSGPVIEKILLANYFDAQIARKIVADEKVAIVKAFEDNINSDFIITTGGTGLSLRDVTPEATLEFCDRMVPGIAEFLRAESLRQTPNAMLSRGVAGMKGSTVIINLPGSVRAVEFSTTLIVPVLPHIMKMVRGEGH